MNNYEQLWTALKHISRENGLEAARGREGKMRSLRPVLPGGVEHHGQQTPGRKRRLKNLKIISWDDMRCTNSLLQHHYHCWTKFWIILNRGPLYSIHKGMWNCIAVLSSGNVA
jgi:hypothetical protein